MSDLLNRLEQLSPEKRELLNLLMKQESGGRQTTYMAPRTPAEETLAAIWSQVLGVDRVGIYDNFLALGGDSIQSIQIVAKAHKAGLQLNTNQLFEHPTIAELATEANTTATPQVELEPVTGFVPLTPIQHWFFEQNFLKPHHWNQSILLAVQPGQDPTQIEIIFQHLLRQHDALRLRFEQQDRIWRQMSEPSVEPGWFSTWNLSSLEEKGQASAIASIATDLQASLNLSQGCLLKVAYFDLGALQPGRLLIIVHHLAVEAVVSFRILMEDIQTAYQQLSRGDTICLPPKTTSFQQWANQLDDYAQSSELQQELAYWLADAQSQPAQLPVDHPNGANTEASTRIVTVSLTSAETDVLLWTVPSVFHTQIHEVLLTGLAQSIAEWTGTRTVLIDLDSHGREDILEGVDISRTVGWFTALFPVRLHLGTTQTAVEALPLVKQQVRSIPKRGIGYGLLRYGCLDQAIGQKLRERPQAEIMFNYLGQFDQILPQSSPFQFAPESCGPLYNPDGHRTHCLQVLSRVFGGQLQVSWLYSEHLHQQATVERVAFDCMKALRSILDSCRSSTGDREAYQETRVQVEEEL